MSRMIIDGPRWLFLACLLYAPWAYGCTTIETILGLLLILTLILSLWMAGSLVRGSRPRMHWLGGACIIALLLQGWWMALNPHYRYDPTSHELLPTVAISRKLPGTIDQQSSVAFMVRITLLMGVVWFVADLVRRPIWIVRLCWAVGLSGASLIFLGLIQKASGAQMIFWAPGRVDRALFFATYNYAGNAGAFINLVTPMVLGMTLVSFRDDRAYFRRALWVSALLISLVGALVNLSRAALLVAALQIFIALVLFSRQRSDLASSLAPSTRLAYSLLGLVAVAILVAAIGWDKVASKWVFLGHQLSMDNPRLIAVRVCLEMLPDAGAMGFGPATFRIAFPHYTHELGRTIFGIWRYAHQDFLQTVIEWGWSGAALWSALFFGGIIRTITLRSSSGHVGISEKKILRQSSLIALIGIAVHALVDFPLQIASLQLYVATYLGVAWSLVASPMKSAPTS